MPGDNLEKTADQKLVYVPPSKVTPYESNPRLNDKAVPGVEKSIRQYGFRKPVLVDEEMVILAGHTAWKAALKIGLEKIPVIISRGLTEDEKRGYRIADNKVSEVAKWNWDLLNAELDELPEDLFTGFGDDEEDPLPSPADDPGGDIAYQEQYGVVVICDDAAHQEETYNKLLEAGYNCRVVVT